jgi:hypothetical protein
MRHTLHSRTLSLFRGMCGSSLPPSLPACLCGRSVHCPTLRLCPCLCQAVPTSTACPPPVRQASESERPCLTPLGDVKRLHPVHVHRCMFPDFLPKSHSHSVVCGVAPSPHIAWRATPSVVAAFRNRLANALEHFIRGVKPRTLGGKLLVTTGHHERHECHTPSHAQPREAAALRVRHHPVSPRESGQRVSAWPSR